MPAPEFRPARPAHLAEKVSHSPGGGSMWAAGCNRLIVLNRTYSLRIVAEAFPLVSKSQSPGSEPERRSVGTFLLFAAGSFVGFLHGLGQSVYVNRFFQISACSELHADLLHLL
jgi:hypothetical protein